MQKDKLKNFSLFTIITLVFFSCKFEHEQKNSYQEEDTKYTPEYNNLSQDFDGFYNNIDLKKNPENLFSDLSYLITRTHTNQISYKELWDVLKKADENPDNSNEVILFYGFNENSNDDTARTRAKNKNGGGKGDWNREHVYPKSLGKPNLGTIGPGADAHMVRASDVKRNGSRGNLPFENAKGNSKRISNSWYPGDEWKGDVARIMMYMYVRYNDRALPKRVAKSTYKENSNMPDLFLKWHNEDPPSKLEKNRNNYVYEVQGNRNPFIDIPKLAELIWGSN